jgi:LAS superfamily LD-carboxypeptidase LdcB
MDNTTLTIAQLTGRDESHLAELACGNQMQLEAGEALMALQGDAQAQGFELAIASSFRSYERQRLIWNGKASGARPVHDDAGQLLSADQLLPVELLHAILRFSAMPGSSRHHWGTDVDVFDAAALDEGYSVELSPAEVAPMGVFDPFHCWLDRCISAGKSHGFYRPYSHDTGGVAVERWHLSYAPISIGCANQISADILRACWDCGEGLLLRSELEENFPEIIERYLTLADDWCPAYYRRTP